MSLTKKEIDRNYYLRHREECLARVAKYQKEHPESHREAARNYERRKRQNLKLVPIIGKIIPDEKLGNKIIFKKERLRLIKERANV